MHESNPLSNSIIIDNLMDIGRPDIIHDVLIEKLRGQPVIEFERLDHLVQLSESVEYLCATLGNSIFSDHQNN